MGAKRCLACVLVSVYSGAMLAHPAAAADADPGWDVAVAPYVWATAVRGTLDAGSVEADFDVEFSDILDVLDAGFLVALEARRGRLHFSANAIYMRLSDETERVTGSALPIAPPRSFEVDIAAEMALAEGAAGYEVWSTPLGGGEGRLALDLRAGARYWYLQQDVDVELRPGVPLPPFQRSFDESGDWIDALIGVRARTRLSERFGFVVAGDYGGFGWGSSSDPSWAVQAIASYALGSHWQLAAGWRHLEIDRGPLELQMTGPLFGALFRF